MEKEFGGEAWRKQILKLLADYQQNQDRFTHVPVPTEMDNVTVGRKFDQGKLRWDLLPYEVIELIVEVLTDGAIKYDDNNWKEVPNAKERYFAAMMRHLVVYKKGERLDESGRCHLAHAASCLMFLMYFTEIDNKNEL